MNSTELRGFLTGLILGDGSIDKGINKRSFRIKSIYKDFIDNIYNEINSCSGFKSKMRYISEHFSCGCYHKDVWEYIIVAHTYFNKIYHYFYDDYRKRIISTQALKWLTPYGLANWYMSDGYVCLVGKTKGIIRDRRVDFCTDRYSIEDIEKIQSYFNSRFNINTSLIKRDKFYRLRIRKDSYETFFMLIYPYLVPSMRYKVYLGYEKQPKWMSDELWAIQEDLKSANRLSELKIG